MEPCYGVGSSCTGDRGINSPLIIKPYHDSPPMTSSAPSPWRGPTSSSAGYAATFSDFDHVMGYPTSSPAYKDLLRDRGQDVSDALMTLKQAAVIHPSHPSNQLSPLPVNLAHISQPPSHHLSAAGMASPAAAAFPYAQSPAPSQLIPSYPHHGFASGSCGQYAGSQYPEQAASSNVSPGSHVHSGHPNMFPSMSVNVSMSMNVGVPGSGPAHHDGFYTGDQWSGTPHNHHHHHHHTPAVSQFSPAAAAQSLPHPYTLQHPQYGNGSTESQPYPAAYSFTADLRSPPNTFTAKDVVYKPSPSIDYRAVSKFYHSFSALHMRNRKSSSSSRSGSESNKLNLCRICGKTYARPSTLKTHMRTHSGEKPYRCATCNKSFSQAANLTAHVRTHSGEKPFRCPVCERRFSQSSSVTTHMRTHSGERPYRCRMCKKAFSDSSTLTKHLRIHSGEKPYQCKLCLLRFSQSGNLNRHMRVHTNSA